MYLEGELQESYGRSGAGVATPSKARTEMLRRALSGRAPGKPFHSQALVQAANAAAKDQEWLRKALLKT